MFVETKKKHEKKSGFDANAKFEIASMPVQQFTTWGGLCWIRLNAFLKSPSETYKPPPLMWALRHMPLGDSFQSAFQCNLFRIFLVHCFENSASALCSGQRKRIGIAVRAVKLNDQVWVYALWCPIGNQRMVKQEILINHSQNLSLSLFVAFRDLQRFHTPSSWTTVRYTVPTHYKSSYKEAFQDEKENELLKI